MADFCIFCAIAAGDIPARVVREDDDTIAFLDISQAGRGHTLVVPRRHVRNLLDAPPDLAGTVFAAAGEVARLLNEGLRPEGFSVFQNNEPAGGQEVFHLHVHVIPRWAGDDLIRPWEPGPPASEEVLDATLAQVVGSA